MSNEELRISAKNVFYSTLSHVSLVIFRLTQIIAHICVFGLTMSRRFTNGSFVPMIDAFFRISCLVPLLIGIMHFSGIHVAWLDSASEHYLTGLFPIFFITIFLHSEEHLRCSKINESDDGLLNIWNILILAIAFFLNQYYIRTLLYVLLAWLMRLPSIVYQIGYWQSGNVRKWNSQELDVPLTETDTLFCNLHCMTYEQVCLYVYNIYMHVCWLCIYRYICQWMLATSPSTERYCLLTRS